MAMKHGNGKSDIHGVMKYVIHNCKVTCCLYNIRPRIIPYNMPYHDKDTLQNGS